MPPLFVCGSFLRSPPPVATSGNGGGPGWRRFATLRSCIIRPMPDTPRRRWRSSAAVQLRGREQRLWQYLRSGQLGGHGFRRQHPVGPFIVDFFCPTVKLVIEVDGDSHAEQAEYDAERTRWLEGQKRYRVIRFTNNEVQHDIEAVVEAIAAAVKAPPP
jgi:very-short-patch-repair endonuclease